MILTLNPNPYQQVVSHERDAEEELSHFQQQYPADPRSFFPTQDQTILAGEVLTLLRERYAGLPLFKVTTTTSRNGKRVGDPDRPYLTDNLVFWMLLDSGLLELGHTAADIDTHLAEVSQAMAWAAGHGDDDDDDDDDDAGRGGRGKGSGASSSSSSSSSSRGGGHGRWGFAPDITRLGGGASGRMATIAATKLGGCFLGFFRDGKLSYNECLGWLPRFQVGGGGGGGAGGGGGNWR